MDKKNIIFCSKNNIKDYIQQIKRNKFVNCNSEKNVICILNCECRSIGRL